MGIRVFGEARGTYKSQLSLEVEEVNTYCLEGTTEDTIVGLLFREAQINTSVFSLELCESR